MSAWKTVVVVLSFVGCDALSRDGGESDSRTRIRDLEARVSALETDFRQRERDDPMRAIKMDVCLERAEGTYWNYVKMNGKPSTAEKHRGKEVWLAPARIWEQAAKEKQNAIEECRILHGKN